MNHYKRGFTLIELLAVIVVLGIILVIAIPKITESINNSKVAAFEDQKKIMLKVARDYIQIHGDDDGTNDGMLTYGFLKSKSLLKPGIKDDKGKVLDDNTLIDTINNRILYLPYSFTQVKYIESTGIQYIDIGVKWNTNNQKIIGKASFSQLTNGGGATISPSVKEGTTYFSLTLRNSDTIPNGRFLSGSTIGEFSFNLQLNTIYEYTIDKNVAYIDGTQVSLVDNFSNSNINMYEFARNTDGTPTLTQYKKIYYLKIYNNDILIRDMIPCYRKSDNVVGMYDLVNSVFYTNAGTGEFLYGE